MRLSDVLRAAFAHIRRTPVFFYANLIAITVGILLVVVMLSMAVGLSRYVDATLKSEASVEMIEVTFDARTPGAKPLTLATLRELGKLPGCRLITPVVDSVFADLRLDKGPETFISLASTVAPNDPEVTRNPLLAGSYENLGGDQSLMVPEETARELGFSPAQGAIGRVVTLHITRSGERGIESLLMPMKIAVVARKTRHARVYAPLRFMRRVARWQSDPRLTARGAMTAPADDPAFAYTAALFYANRAEDVPALRAAVEKRGYRTASILDSVERYRQIMLVAGVVLTSLGLIALFTGSISIFNTAYAAVMRRMREFAIYKTYGATKKAILSLVLAEAIITAIAAGILGFAGGSAICLLLQRAVSAEVEAILFPVEWWLLGVAILTASLATIAASAIPARNAAELSATEAMRAA
ncbi:MAG TPA: ABC transporter permease [Gemmatimonadaceae bacterium]